MELDSPRAEAALAEFEQSVRVLEAGEARLEAARSHVAWGPALRRHGEVGTAREHFEAAARQFDASGLEAEPALSRRLINATC